LKFGMMFAIIWVENNTNKQMEEKVMFEREFKFGKLQSFPEDFEKMVGNAFGYKPGVIKKIIRDEFEESYPESMRYIQEDDEKYYIKMELPGVGRDNININLENNIINVKYTKNKKDYERVIKLPEKVRSNINFETINSKYIDGVLYINLVKNPDKIPKKMNIRIE